MRFMPIPFRCHCLATIVAVLALGPTASATPPSAADLAQLDRHRTGYAAALLAGDAEAAVATCASEVRLMPEFQRTMVGRDRAFAYQRAFVSRFAVREYGRTPVKRLDLGSRLVEVGTFVEKLVLKSTGREYELAGKYLELWTKQPDGSLALDTAAWNASHGIDWGDLLRFPDVPGVVAAFQARTPVTTNGRFELAALCRLLETAVTQHDAPLLGRFYADDAILAPNFDALAQGRAAIDRYWTKHAAELPTFEKLDIRNDRVDELDGYLVEYASHVANWRNGDASGVNTGKNLRIWRREPDHALKMIVQLGSYD